MPWYKTGTVKTTTNSNAIIGTGTAFISNSRVGDAFRGPDGNWYEVVNIASDTAMSISPNYQGPTVAAGTYSIAPMQGYIKESADRLRQTVESIGATLALFGGATNVTQLRANIGAAQNGTNSDITNITGLTTALSIAQGGTGAKTPPLARAALGLGDAAVATVVGAGGIIERGSNANGEYTKFVDGTLLCWGFSSGTPSTSTASGYYGSTSGIVYVSSVSVTLPSTFLNNAYSFLAKSRDRGLAELAFSRTTNSATVQIRGMNTTDPVTFDFIVVGRWK